MIQIETVEIKTTKTGKEYKNLKLKDGTFVNMWNDDADYMFAESGVELDRELEQNGQYQNLVASGASPSNNPKQSAPTKSGDLEKKIDGIYFVLRKIADHLKIDTGENERIQEVKQVDIYDGDINPADIPF